MFLRQLLGLLLLFMMVSCSERDYRERKLDRIQTNSIKEHPYWSRVYSFKDSDSVQLDIPVELSFEFVLEDLLSFETNKPNYIIKSSLYAYHDKEVAYELKDGDTLFLMPERKNLFRVVHPENSYLKQTPWNYDGTFEGEAQFSKYLETEMYHNWDMTRYPFDVQKVTLRIESLQDSSLVRIRDSKVFPPNFSGVRNLRKGFVIDTILFNETFEETTIYDEDLGRAEVRSIGEFHMMISRKNSWLFLKLFSGGLIAMFISWLSFFITKDEFESRIELSIGSIIAVVGNKYFVDSAISSEILTVADVMNNLFILLVVINTFYIVYVQRNGDNRWWLKPVSMFVITLLVFVLASTATLLLA
jgi:hypothetical protein